MTHHPCAIIVIDCRDPSSDPGDDSKLKSHVGTHPDIRSQRNDSEHMPNLLDHFLEGCHDEAAKIRKDRFIFLCVRKGATHRSVGMKRKLPIGFGPRVI